MGGKKKQRSNRQIPGTPSHGGRRRMFTKLVRDGTATMSSLKDARRFIEGINTFPTKALVLSELDDSRMFGRQRIQEALSFVSDSPGESTDYVLFPTLNFILDEECSRPTNKCLRNRFMMAIFKTPGLIETLGNLCIHPHVSVEDLEVMCRFVQCISKLFSEVRQSIVIQSIAQSLMTKDIRGSMPLHSLLFPAIAPPTQHCKTIDESKSRNEVTTWVTDMIKPGGRHNNDFLNFRDVSIVPTLEELECDKRPYLPLYSGENAVIIDKTSRLLDSNFRLLREDALHSMRESLNNREKVWQDARIIGMYLGDKRNDSLSFVLQCESRVKSKIDWERSKAFPLGGIIALCKDGNPIRIGVITIRRIEGKWLKSRGGPRIGISFEEEVAFEESFSEVAQNSSLNESLVNADDTNKRKIILSNMEIYDLIEISRSFFSYRPVLTSLQDMEGVPFEDEFVHCQTNDWASYLPPCVCLPDTEHFKKFRCNLSEWNEREILSSTTLDESQARAVHHALTNRVALVQGPPGCGKSFIGALLARIIRDNSNESILCVCYTNHALDQFLEHLYENGERKIVRVGGRSKSSLISKFSLRELARTKTDLGRDSSRRIRSIDAELHKLREGIERQAKIMAQPLAWESPFGGAKSILYDEHPSFLEQLHIESEDSGGFQVVKKKNQQWKESDLWDLWRKGRKCPKFLQNPPFNKHKLDSFEFWKMNQVERDLLVSKLRKELLWETRRELFDDVGRYEELFKEKKLILQEKYSNILKDAKVIGATTTGAAQYRELLAEKAAGVVIVEEAGEVFESHVLSALTPQSKHCILIGDHLQLPPKAESYKLTCSSKMGYNIDISLFERLILSKTLPSTMLAVQHRMRPEFSEIIRMQTYPSLKDHHSVLNRPNVRGVTHNILFLNHHVKEDGKQSFDFDHQKTKSNSYEASLVVELARFFLLQGYAHSKICIITPYVGQLLQIYRTMSMEMKETTAYISELDRRQLDDEDENGLDENSSDDKQIRVATVDNFQGEEADIIIASLVRSNDKGNIGFLKEEQRVNVLMSRARVGMFIVGNAETLCRSSKGKQLWDPILKKLDDAGQLKDGFPTFCQNHPADDITELCQPCDFREFRPNGGCSRPCTYRMSCGHQCPMTCHIVDPKHTVAETMCVQPCPRFPVECTFGHQCQKLCKDECGPCLTIVDPTRLTCGHILERPRCHDIRNDEAIKLATKACKVQVEHTFADCNHTFETTCSNSRFEQKCPGKCEVKMDCGHPCSRRCGSCEKASSHQCTTPCERKLFCGHACGMVCHEDDCKPCEKKCDVRCEHSSCPKKCSDVCASCLEPCTWSCEHRGACPLVCGAPCVRLPCNERCTKILDCGHQCPSVCGEQCPDRMFCQDCCSDEHKNYRVDLFTMMSYKEIELDNDPIIVLPCNKHFYCISTLDEIMELKKFYVEENNNFVASCRPSGVSVTPKCCPECRKKIHSIKRYGRVSGYTDLRVQERKNIVAAEARLGNDSSIKRKGLEKIIRLLERGPTRKIYEACGGHKQLDIHPPDRRMLVTLKIKLSHMLEKVIKKFEDENYKKALKIAQEAVQIAMIGNCTKLFCEGTILCVKIRMGWERQSRERNHDLLTMLDRVLGYPQFEDLCEQAKTLKTAMESPSKDEVKKMLDIITTSEDFSKYGGKPSDHWYECPNGHAYFIGECGGAMETSLCADCGAEIGGSNHSLLQNNRHLMIS